MASILRDDGFWPRDLAHPPMQTVEADGYKSIPGETIPRRHPAAKSALITQPTPGVATVFDILKYAVVNHADAPAFGYRPHIRNHTESKSIPETKADGSTEFKERKWTYYELGKYKYINFIEFEQMVLDLGSGMRKLGLAKGDRLEIFASTSLFWFAFAHGASSQSMTVVTAYDSLGPEGLAHSLTQTKAKAVFADGPLISRLAKPLEQATDVQFVIYNTNEAPQPEELAALQEKHPRLRILSFDELRQLGSQDRLEPVPPAPEDVCLIMYTSGSTGPPKGVTILQKNVVAAVAGIDLIIGQYLRPGDKVLGYLPLAHIIEFIFENAAMYWGNQLGYANPRTLTDINVRNCRGDLFEFKPVLMLGVPAVWETVKKGILAKAESSALKKAVFWGALNLKYTLLSLGLVGAAKWLDYAIFNKVKEATGGELLLVFNGGGPIASATQRFISLTLAPMISGYGMTETCGMGSISDPRAWTDNAIGTIGTCVEVKLVDLPELGYRTDREPPQGEVWIRGGAVCAGYFQLDKENAETFEDGWMKTGDIGEFDKFGRVKIIDRKKNLVKNLNGEYVALEKVRRPDALAVFSLANACNSSSPSTAPAPLWPTCVSLYRRTEPSRLPSSRPRPPGSRRSPPRPGLASLASASNSKPCASRPKCRRWCWRRCRSMARRMASEAPRSSKAWSSLPRNGCRRR